MKMYPRCVFIILVILSVSCTKSEGPDKIVGKMKVTPFLEVNTKSLTDNDNIIEKSVGIQITDFPGTTLYEGILDYNIARVRFLSNWVIDDGNGNFLDVILTSENAKIYAYSPFSANITGTGENAFLNIDVARDREAGEMIDYLWSAQSTSVPEGVDKINCNNANVLLRLNHSMSIISFVIYNEGYEGDGVLNSFEVIDNSLSPSLRVNKIPSNDLRMKLSDGTISGGELVSNMKVMNINSSIDLTEDPGVDPVFLFGQKNCHILISPMTIADRSKLEFCFTIDGVSYYAKLEGAGPISFTQGNIYMFTAKLSPKMIDITGVTEWNILNYEAGSGYS